MQIPAVDHPMAVNIGGGLPGFTDTPTTRSAGQSPDEYRETFHHWHALTSQSGLPRHLGRPNPDSPLADAGITRPPGLDVRPSGLAAPTPILEVGRYSRLSRPTCLPITAHPIGVGRPQPYIVAGPTCDTADTLGTPTFIGCPDTLQPGDPILSIPRAPTR